MKETIYICGLLFITVFSFSVRSVFAHGVVHEVNRENTVVIKVGYDDGEPMSYAEVKIYSPDNSKVEYQNGRTDKNGCFSFLPPRTGEWKIVINDGMGHGVVTRVPVKEIKEGLEIESSNHGLSLGQKLLIAISIVWGLVGTALYFKKKN